MLVPLLVLLSGVCVMSYYNSNLSNKSYFRSIIPKDLQKNFGGSGEFRLSLRYVINGDTQILCLKLK